MTTFTLSLPPIVQLTDEQFYELCQAHQDLKFERSVKGDLIIMSPTGGGTGKRNSDINTDLNLWNRQTRLGVVFDSSTGFILPNGATRSPDVAWISLEKWNNLRPEQQEQFIPLCPDFVIELRSSSDSLPPLQNKMPEYIDNGMSLGWLINRKDQQVEIYRKGQEKEVLNFPAFLSGEDVLPGFILNLATIW